MTPQEFFKKNNKWILLVVSVLFVIKSVQSCNRNMVIQVKETEIVNLQDSLSTMFGTEKEELVLQLRDCEAEVVKYKHQADIANTRAEAAERRADAVESTASKIRENTTIKIENNSSRDTISVNK
jgi:hypothetical protein